MCIIKQQTTFANNYIIYKNLENLTRKKRDTPQLINRYLYVSKTTFVFVKFADITKPCIVHFAFNNDKL